MMWMAEYSAHKAEPELRRVNVLILHSDGITIKYTESVVEWDICSFVRYLCRGPTCGSLPHGGAINHRPAQETAPMLCSSMVSHEHVVLGMSLPQMRNVTYCLPGKHHCSLNYLQSYWSYLFYHTAAKSSSVVDAVVSRSKKSKNHFIYSIHHEQQADYMQDQDY